MCFVGAVNAQNLFNQDFTSSASVDSYFSNNNSPTTHQLNSISKFGSTQPSISNTSLKWTKTNGQTSGSSAVLIRNTPISTGDISFLKFQFKLKLSYLSASDGTSGFLVYLGSGSNTNWTSFSSTAAPVDSELFTKFDFPVETKEDPDNTVRYRIGSSSVFSSANDWEEVTIFCNKSASQVSYIGMNGNSTSLAANAIDVWFGTTRVRTAVAATTSSVNPSMFKMVFPSQMHAMNIELDYIKAWDQTVLPVTLTGFSGKAVESGVKLNWETASEKNNSHFEVLRANNAIDFQTIATISSKGNSNTPSAYQYIDYSPLVGTNYYKLKQVDFDGQSEEFEKVVMANFGLSKSNLQAYYTNSALKVIYQKQSNAVKANVKLVDISGRIILSDSFKLNEGINHLSFNKNLSSGVYLLNVEENGKLNSIKIII